MLRIIIIVLGIFLLVRWTLKGLARYFLGDTTKEMNAQILRQQQELARQKKKQEGKVTINYQPQAKKNFAKNDGDYVDFEEVR